MFFEAHKYQIFEFNNRLATTLAIICCYKGALPQGAPTSPILANMICYNLDKKMIELAKENRCISFLPCINLQYHNIASEGI